MKENLTIFFALLVGVCTAQTISSRSNEATLDFTSGANTKNGSIPKITWIAPENETSFQKEAKITLGLEIESKQPLKSIVLTVRDKEANTVKGTTNLPINGVKNLTSKIEKVINLTDGVNEVLIEVENESGFKSLSRREIHVGATRLADAAKLGRKDYALIFATDKYDQWNTLTNPIFDAHTISDELKSTYGFQTDVVENATQEQVILKFREYNGMKFNPLDQLFIFFAGHGFYDETMKEGFVITKESLLSDLGTTSYLRHSTLQTTIDKNPCPHIFLVMDVCFGGTFEEVKPRGSDEIYGEPTQSEMIAKKLEFKTRKFLTSGGKEYVSDGAKGQHSPFARQFIAALETKGGNDGILTLSELMTFIEKTKSAQHIGSFGSDKQNSEFVFVVK